MVFQDTIEHYKGSLIQHGRYNDRIYLIKLAPESPPTLSCELITFAQQKGYSKIFAKVPEYQADSFFSSGFIEEAQIPGFYNGRVTALFVAYYLTAIRSEESETDRLKEILTTAIHKNDDYIPHQLADELTLRPCKEADSAAMADIYRTIFSSYPFPIHDPDYIKETMNSHIDYFGIESQGQLVAISSAEMDTQARNVEMTDFATLPDWRKNGFAQHLLYQMEEVMASKGIETAYTIARAISTGMNSTFGKAGYQFGGRL